MAKYFSLEQAEAVAPLVRSIMRSISHVQTRLNALRDRSDMMFECRHASDYRARRQYYRDVEESRQLDGELESLTQELHDAGAELVDPQTSTAGIPFRYNPKSVGGPARRKAYFLIDADNEAKGIRQYRIAGEHKNRTIPVHWRHLRRQRRTPAK